MDLDRLCQLMEYAQFARRAPGSTSSETIVMITPRIVGAGAAETDPASLATVEQAASAKRAQAQGTDRVIESLARPLPQR
jgi:hypothetical protein